MIGFEPAGSVLMENDAVAELPAAPVRGWVTVTVVPSVKTTEPVGVPDVVDKLVTVAVKVDDWPYGAGLSEEARAVAVARPVTVWVAEKEIPP